MYREQKVKNLFQHLVFTTAIKFRLHSNATTDGISNARYNIFFFFDIIPKTGDKTSYNIVNVPIIKRGRIIFQLEKKNGENRNHECDKIFPFAFGVLSQSNS